MTSSILKTANGLIFPLTLVFAIYMALKGHNEPGGGFVGGLIMSVAFVLYRMSHGREAMQRLMPIHPRVLIASGLLIAVLTGVIPKFFGLPFLTSRAPYIYPLGQEVHLPSAIAFDFGVLLVVVGVSVGMIVRLGEEVDEA